MATRLKRVQRGKVVGQRGGRAAKAPLQTANVGDATFDQARLRTQTYLTVEELVAYLRFPSAHACRVWVTRTGLPKCRRGRTLLVLRRDVDQAVQPGNQLQGRRLEHDADDTRRGGASATQRVGAGR
jgi:hypothetical protein